MQESRSLLCCSFRVLALAGSQGNCMNTSPLGSCIVNLSTSFFSLFRNEFDKFNSTDRSTDSVYQMTLKELFACNVQDFAINTRRCNDASKYVNL